MKIEYHESNIDAKIKENEDLLKDFESQFKGLKGALDTLFANWSGEDAIKFKEYMNTFSSNIQIFMEQVQKYDSFVSGYMKSMSAVNNEYKDKRISLK